MAARSFAIRDSAYARHRMHVDSDVVPRALRPETFRVLYESLCVRRVLCFSAFVVSSPRLFHPPLLFMKEQRYRLSAPFFFFFLLFSFLFLLTDLKLSFFHNSRSIDLESLNNFSNLEIS